MDKNNKNKNVNNTDKKLHISGVSGWRLFQNEKPLDGNRYHYSIGNQFFKGVWNEELEGFLLDGCNGTRIIKTCDYFHACH